MIIQELGRFIAETRYEDLPFEVLEMAKLRVLDLLTSALVGFRLGHFRPLFEILGGKKEATVWGEGVQYPLRDAVLLNSFMAHSPYLEDGSRYTGGHPSSAVIPAALSFGETRGASGKSLILSVSLGYEIFLRLGRAIYPSTVVRGFQSTAVLGALGSAAACASLLGLEREGCKNALAIACNLGVGLKDALKTPNSQPLQVGHSCEGGVLAALLAAKGVSGSDTVVENGFLRAFADQPGETGVLAGLGTNYRMGETYIKIHGGCRGNHAPTDVILALMKTQKISPQEIAEIRVKVDSVTMAADIHNPMDGLQALLSIPFSIAVAVLEGNASIYQFTDEKVKDPGVRSTMSKIVLEVDKKLDEGYPDKRSAQGEIILKDGRHYSSFMDNARGEPESPLSAEEIEEKFLFYTREILGKKTEEVCAQVKNLEKIDDVRDLVRKLKG